MACGLTVGEKHNRSFSDSCAVTAIAAASASQIGDGPIRSAIGTCTTRLAAGGARSDHS